MSVSSCESRPCELALFCELNGVNRLINCRFRRRFLHGFSLETRKIACFAARLQIPNSRFQLANRPQAEKCILADFKFQIAPCRFVAVLLSVGSASSLLRPTCELELRSASCESAARVSQFCVWCHLADRSLVWHSHGAPKGRAFLIRHSRGFQIPDFSSQTGRSRKISQFCVFLQI